MPYGESIVIRSCECDIHGRWKPSAIMEAMQDVAVAHCESVGLPREATSAMGVIWVLSRCRVEFDALPKNGERIGLETWAIPTRHLFYRRCHLFRNAAGEPIGGAQAFWLLMDIEARKAVTCDGVAELLPIEALDAPTRPPRAVSLPEAEPKPILFTPPYTDFDLNGHVNNTRYLDWCWNALGFDALRDREIAAFDVNYDREILPGEPVDAALYSQGDDFAYVARANGARCFAASGTLRAARVESV